MQGNSITNEPIDNLQNMYLSGYAEDTWKALPKLTISYGVRYDYNQPTGEMAGGFANFVPLTRGYTYDPVTGNVAGTGTANYVLPARWQNTSGLLASSFTSLLTANNTSVVYDSNERLSTGQKTNFAPRVSVALMADSRTVFRAGAGVFYGATFRTRFQPQHRRKLSFHDSLWPERNDLCQRQRHESIGNQDLAPPDLLYQRDC